MQKRCIRDRLSLGIHWRSPDLTLWKPLRTLFQHPARALRPKQLRALALARQGSPRSLDEAQEILGELYASGQRDPETLGIYGATWMDRYRRSGNLDDLRQSRDLYAEAFDRAPDDYYTGVNAASKSVLLGTEVDLNSADLYAKRVQTIVGTEPVQGDYWMTATVAEVLLIQQKYKDAAEVYAAAVSMARSESGSHQAAWIQACNLMAKLQPVPEDRLLIRAAFAHLPDCQDLLSRTSPPSVGAAS
ncbi:MAG: TRAFs-binding domain-containing protein [Bryobacteraceae bacterium]